MSAAVRKLHQAGGGDNLADEGTTTTPTPAAVAMGEPALAGALVEAHQSAVDAALGYLEREACGYAAAAVA